MAIEYRQITSAEHRRFGVAVARGFGGHYEPSHERFQLDKRTLSPEMTICAFDGGEIVGTSAAYPFESGVPGGAIIGNAGVTAITVAPTHHRQGLLTNMMKRLLKQERENGQPVASLWASESNIYGRFGYGMSIQHQVFKIDTRKAGFASIPKIPGRVRFVDIDEAREVFPHAWDFAVKAFAGIPRCDDDNWDRMMSEFSEKREWGKPWFVVYEEKKTALGFASYFLKASDVFDEQVKIPHGLINADMVIHSNPASHAALWKHLLNIDLYDTLSTWRSPSDDSLPWMLADRRQLERKPYDGVWYRLLDVAEALSARTYLTSGTVIVEVEDSFIPEWGGRFELTGGPDGAICASTSRAADITVPAATLATIYLGGARLTELERAGRAEENTSGAVALADAMFATVRAPWCPIMF
jgi:predicted acetyltransferase